MEFLPNLSLGTPLGWPPCQGKYNQRMSVLSDRRIMLGVTGSITAYKAADLASKLAQAGAQVDGDCRSCNAALPV